jgi:hypothetical protein
MCTACHSCPSPDATIAQLAHGATCVESPYEVVLIAEAPALTLAQVHTQLLPLARESGFTAVSVQQTIDGAGQTFYEAYARRPGAHTALVRLPWEVTTPAQLLEEATATLRACLALTLDAYAYV